MADFVIFPIPLCVDHQFVDPLLYRLALFIRPPLVSEASAKPFHVIGDGDMTRLSAHTGNGIFAVTNVLH